MCFFKFQPKSVHFIDSRGVFGATSDTVNAIAGVSEGILVWYGQPSEVQFTCWGGGGGGLSQQF